MEEAGVDWFGVATWEEAAELRAAGIRSPILLLTGPGSADPQQLAEHDVAVALLDREELHRLGNYVTRRPLRLHLKVDTGMGRLGIFPEQVPALVEELRHFRHLVLEGVFSHFASASEVRSPFARQQLERFLALRGTWAGSSGLRPLFHLANSAATLNLPESHCDMVRPGIALYGASPDPATPLNELQPVMRLVAPVVQVREVPANTPVSYGQTFITSRPSRLAVVGIGYADGYDRRMSGRAEVLVRGRRAPVVGRVCMDLTVVDVTDLPEVRRGDPVVLWGTQGRDRIDLAEASRWCGAIPYELLTRIGRRVRRVLVETDHSHHGCQSEAN